MSITTDTTDAEAAAILRRTGEIRSRAGLLTERARAGDSEWFRVDDDRLDDAVTLVAEVTRRRYPTLDIPFHSRWRHVEAGGVDRAADLDRRLDTADTGRRARAQIDLAVVSVLLDAGAGPDWYFDEPGTGLRFTRSEGLAVAGVHAFFDGVFSSDPADPLRVDAAGLRALTADRLAAAFGVTDRTPLVGLEGRTALLHRLADALDTRSEVYTDTRPGGLFDHLGGTDSVGAHDILSVLLDTLAPIWLAGNQIGEVPLGDCWPHPVVRGEQIPAGTAGWMPFHKLSQWLTYSLLEPFSWAGVEVTGLDELTALPEYRNGGLLIDTGVLTPRPADAADTVWQVGDELVVEWRALTVALLGELAPRVADALGVDPASLPLACVLEGGTWAAGRELAAVRRNGLPPLQIASDGTVF
ncbi:URC4/urg3 family protein [Gordonia sp. NB41Y]|uniref:URC4/urg3 family protein n=1 Tax=Gordonia sp. NB41Y TaxID=875808 RepID=UPI00273C0AD8|nr:URC4/urg3 family protein [Gordonia sp. NB41Y]WLP90676.1 URC4/urg3 family protein [Gordonia sp. NB41Y]